MMDHLASPSETLNQILGTVLDLNRLEGGERGAGSGPVHLQSLVAQTIALFAPAAQDKGLVLKSEIFAPADCWGLSDATRLKQILTTLLGAAIRFTERGEVRLSVLMAEKGRLLFEVVDTGSGFGEAERRRLFQPIPSAEAPGERGFGDASPGLCIARQLAQHLGGVITASSVPGLGSTFSLSLPFPASKGHNTPPSPIATDLPRLRVLLAEDNAANRLAAELMLRAIDAEVTSVCDGLQAVEAFGLQPFDLVLMDLQMPRLDGHAAIRSIRATERKVARAATPILVLSAHALEEHVAESFLVGADDHVAKPFKAEDLFGAIRRALEAHAAPAPLARAG